MPSRPDNKILRLSADISQLTQALTIQPSELLISQYWMSDQSILLSKLPPYLRRSWISSLPLLSTSLSLFSPQKTSFCKMHRILNPKPINNIFQLIQDECSTCLKHLIGASALPGEVTALVQRLQMLNFLWSTPDSLSSSVRALQGESRYEMVKDKCQACILARIGGDRDKLYSLRAAIKGHRRSGKEASELLPFVDAWILNVEGSERIMMESDELSKIVLACRRRLQRERRGIVQKLPIKKAKRPAVNVQDATVDEKPCMEDHLHDWVERAPDVREGYHEIMTENEGSLMNYRKVQSASVNIKTNLEPPECTSFPRHDDLHSGKSGQAAGLRVAKGQYQANEEPHYIPIDRAALIAEATRNNRHCHTPMEDNRDENMAREDYPAKQMPAGFAERGQTDHEDTYLPNPFNISIQQYPIPTTPSYVLSDWNFAHFHLPANSHHPHPRPSSSIYSSRPPSPHSRSRAPVLQTPSHSHSQPARPSTPFVGSIQAERQFPVTMGRLASSAVELAAMPQRSPRVQDAAKTNFWRNRPPLRGMGAEGSLWETKYGGRG